MAKQDRKFVSASGATSSGQKPRYDLIPQTFLRRVADRFGYGARKHSPFNWVLAIEKQDKEYILERLNHAQEHLTKAISDIHHDRTPEDDDLGGVGVNVAMAMEFQEAKWEARGLKVQFPSYGILDTVVEEQPSRKAKR